MYAILGLYDIVSRVQKLSSSEISLTHDLETQSKHCSKVTYISASASDRPRLFHTKICI